MKIAIDVTGSIYEGSGVATYYRNLIPGLQNLNSRHQFIPFGYSFRRRSDLKLAAKTFPLPPRLMEIVWNRIHKIPVETLIGPCDIVHTWDYIQPPTKKARIVTTIHDLTPLKFPNYHPKRTVSAYQHGLNWIKKEADAVITDSYTTKVDLIEEMQIESKKIHVVYLGVSPEFRQFHRSLAEQGPSLIERVKKNYGITGEYLLSVGTHEPRKNLDRVIEAFSILKLNKNLVIAGNYGWGKKPQNAKGVQLIGYVAQEDLPALYAGASCFIYPSLYEGFGLPVVEAMAVGCPVVTSYKGSLAEIATDAAVLVNPEKVDAIALGIEAALHNRKFLIEAGLKQSAKFTWEQTAIETLKVYESVGKNLSR
jgi:glycosyltransferase involved in cell wall biosynthesis